jgi:hypothetical protein
MAKTLFGVICFHVRSDAHPYGQPLTRSGKVNEYPQRDHAVHRYSRL